MNELKTKDFRSLKTPLSLWLIKSLPFLHLQEALPGWDCTPMECEGRAEAASPPHLLHPMPRYHALWSPGAVWAIHASDNRTLGESFPHPWAPGFLSTKDQALVNTG